MISSEALKKARSKPSCINISSTANPMPPLERNKRGLFAKRLRQASGTKPAGRQKRWRSDGLVPMLAEKLNQTSAILQPGDIPIEVKPINRLELERDMTLQQISHIV